MGSSDLTGLLGIVVIAGLAYVFLSSGALDNLNNTQDPGFVEGGDPSEEPGTTEGGTSNCGQLCRDKDCDGYKENCTTGCSNCCDSGPNSKPCKDKSGGSNGDSQCKALCTAGSCVQYRAECSKSCSRCAGSGKCTLKCTAGYKRASTGCSCVSTGGTSGGVSCSKGYVPKNGRCECNRVVKNCSSNSVTRLVGGVCKCQSCGSGYHRGTKSSLDNTCIKNSGGSSGSSCKSCCTCRGGACKNLTGATCTSCCGGGSGSGSCSCKQGGKCASYPANSANCCSWRGRNGGCPSGTIGKPHKGGGCDCVRGSSYARALYTGAVPRVLRANSRLAWRLSTG